MSDRYLWENVFTRKPRETIADVLKRVPIFESLSRRDLKSFERILHRRTYAENEPIFRQGDVGLGMYIIESGEVSIVSGPDERELVRLHDGDFFGEVALFEEERRNAGAIAVRETRVFGFFQPDLYSLLESHPRIGVSVVMRLSRIIVERLNRANSEISRLRASAGDDMDE